MSNLCVAAERPENICSFRCTCLFYWIRASQESRQKESTLVLFFGLVVQTTSSISISKRSAEHVVAAALEAPGHPSDGQKRPENNCRRYNACLVLPIGLAAKKMNLGYIPGVVSQNRVE